MHRKKRRVYLLLSGLMVLISLSQARALPAQSSPNYEIRWFSFSTGGDQSAPNVRVRDAVGQPASGLSTGLTTELRAGYIQADPVEFIFLPLVNR